ncbi:tail protein [Pectobacterium phage PPWS4]|uniref:Tubular protein A n=1 Tax=Pectobacterium phage PPWS4 TaxID=1961914 RepID=A0A250KA85_9CAUD|nr:tail protein [Pectobacterium phage PPWS4]BBA26454.1 tubular protein A [Pectobacterium phage PPWS4]
MAIQDLNVDSVAELDAVNDILAAIGEAPVNTLMDDSNADVANARRILNTTNRKVQSKGWTFNIEEGAVLQPDVFSNLIDYSNDYLSVMSTGSTSVYINRGGYLYDRTALTDQFTAPVSVNLIRLRAFDDMPECFRTLIVTEAARMFNSRYFGAPEIEAVLRSEILEAKAACMEYEMDYGKYNMLDGDSHVQGLLSR